MSRSQGLFRPKVERVKLEKKLVPATWRKSRPELETANKNTGYSYCANRHTYRRRLQYVDHQRSVVESYTNHLQYGRAGVKYVYKGKDSDNLTRKKHAIHPDSYLLASLPL